MRTPGRPLPERPGSSTLFGVDGEHASRRVVRVDTQAALGPALSAVGLECGPVLVVVGGASGLTGDAEKLVRTTVHEVVLPVAIGHGATIVDGGTDSGVMRILGAAHRAADARSPLVGVAVRRLVRFPDQDSAAPSDNSALAGRGAMRLPGDAVVAGPAGVDLAEDAAPAEPNHTHLVLVAGQRWGDESPWLSAVAERLSCSYPAVTLVLNGGAITLCDVALSVSAGRPVAAVAGTGRSADLLAAASATPHDDLTPVDDADVRVAHAAAASGLLTILDPGRPLADQRDQLSRLLRPGQRLGARYAGRPT